MKNVSTLFISLTILFWGCSSNDDDINTELTRTQYTLTVTAGEGGTVSTQGGTYNEGTELTITATPWDGYIFKGWSNGSGEAEINITVNSNMELTANFEINYYVISVGDREILIDQTKMPISCCGQQGVQIFHEIVDEASYLVRIMVLNTESKNNIDLWKKKLIKWEGDIDSHYNPILINATGQVIRPVVDDLYDYLNENYDLPFIYDFGDQITISENKPMGWEGNQVDFDGDDNPDLLTASMKKIKVTRFNHESFNYSLLREMDITDLFEDGDSLGMTSIFGDFNNDQKLDFFSNLQYENIPKDENGNYITDQTTFQGGPMALIYSNGNDYEGVVVDDGEYLRFPGSFKTVDWNMDGNLDVFASMPYEVYLNNGDNTFTKIELSELIQPELDWLSIRFEDLNSDGYIDIIGANFNMQISKGFGMEIYYGNSDGTFDYETVYHPLYNQLWNGSDDLTIVDLDNDGFMEILTYNMIELHMDFNRPYDVSELREFKSNGSNYVLNYESNYNLTIRTNGGSTSNSTTAWDFDNDGDKDIFLQSHNDTYSVFAPYVNQLNSNYPFNQILKCNLPTTEEYDSGNNYSTGFFFENIDGILHKKYFSELYFD